MSFVVAFVLIAFIYTIMGTLTAMMLGPALAPKGDGKPLSRFDWTEQDLRSTGRKAIIVFLIWPLALVFAILGLVMMLFQWIVRGDFAVRIGKIVRNFL